MTRGPLEARRKLIFDVQRYAAEQQYYVYLYSVGLTGSCRRRIQLRLRQPRRPALARPVSP